MILARGRVLPSFNPATINEWPSQFGPTVANGFSDTTGKTQVSAAPVGGQKTLVFLCFGQSQLANGSGGNYTPTNLTVHHINPYDGLCYRATGELLGCSGGSGLDSYVKRLGDELINAGVCARVIFINLAKGGSTALNWCSQGQFNHQMMVAFILARRNAYPVSGVLWDAGTTDNGLGTTQDAQKKNLADMIASTRGFGYFGPWFLAKHSMNGGSASSAVRGAIDDVVAPPSGVYLGPDLDTLGGENLSEDGTHFTATGAGNAAGLWKTILTDFGY